MGCLCCEKSINPESTKTDLRVTSQGRSCTNCYCIILFAATWCVFIAFLIVGISNGEQDRLWYATNNVGDLCGGSKYKEMKYVYYPRLTDDLLESANRLGNELSQDISLDMISEIHLYGVCVDKCPSENGIVCSNDYTGTTPAPPYSNSGDLPSGCWVVPMNTSSVFYRCMFNTNLTKSENVECYKRSDGVVIDSQELKDPNDIFCMSKKTKKSEEIISLAHASPVMEELLFWKTRFTGWLGDLVTTYPIIILFGILLPLILSFIYVLFVKFTIKCFVYILLVLSIAISVIFTIFCFYQAAYFTSDQLDKLFNPFMSTSLTEYLPEAMITLGDNQIYWEYGAWFMVAFDLVIFVLVIFTWSDIKLIVSAIEISGDVLFTNPLLLLIPIFFVIQYVLFTIFFVYSSAMLFTITVDTNVTSTERVEFDNGRYIIDPLTLISSNQQDYGFYMMWFNLFGFYWTTQVVYALYIMVIAGTVGQYYFKPRNQTDHSLSKEYPEIDTEQRENAVCNAFTRAHRYHLGTAIFGALIIAIVRIIRAILLYIQKQMSGSQSKIVKCLLCCLSCCFWCLDNCLSFISTNAYIICALKGYGFVKSCKHVISTVTSNIKLFALKAATITTLQFLGKFMISAIAGYATYWYLGAQPKYHFGGSSELSNSFIPTLVAFLLAFVTASIYMSLFGHITDSLVMCLLEDESTFYKQHYDSPFTPANLVSELKSRN